MWKRISSNLQTLAPWRSPLHSNHHNILLNRLLITASSPSSAPQSPFQKTSPLFSANSAVAKGSKMVEEVMPIATGHEREEIEAELQGRDLAEMDHPEGPFGTKEAPAIIKSIFDKRIVGCPGGEGEDEHDVVWFWLEKGKPHECPVCTQYFQLEVIGPGGSPDGHDH